MGNVSCVRRRAFHHRSGYSNAGNNDLESDTADIDAADTVPRLILPTKIRKPRRRLVGWRYKKSPEIVVRSGTASEARRSPSAPLAKTPEVVAVSATVAGNCNCQRNGCVVCEIMDNLPPSGRMKRKRLININTCNVFDLMALDGVDQSIATNIVIYREKKGRFKQLDKLLKVPGVTKSIYCRMAPYVTVVSLEDDDSSGLHINEGDNNAGGSGGNLVPRVSKDKGHSRQSSAFSSHKSSGVGLVNDGLDLLLRIPVDTDGGKDLEQANIDLIYRLMCSKSERPKTKSELDKDAGLEQQQQSASYDLSRLRMGCWDLEGCSFDKAHNPGVLEVICMTILENRWNFVAMVNFTSDHVLDRLVTELNFPTLHKVKLWRQTTPMTPRFDCLSLHCIETDTRYGYLYGTPFATLERSDAKCQIFKFGSTNVAFRYGASDAIDPNENAEQISLDENVVHIEKRITEAPSASGNLLYFGQYAVHWNGILSSKFTGRAGMVEDGLSHLAIPNGWTLGGRVTRSNPCWFHFSLNDDNRL